MELKTGQRLKSSVCDVNVIVVRAPTGDVDLRCGGAAMIEMNSVSSAGDIDPKHADGTTLGKRYGDEQLELLCTKAGAGSLSIGDTPIGHRVANALPASD